MFDNSRGGADHPLKLWGRKHPKAALWGIGAVVAVIVIAFLASAHHSGVLMITPGKKETPLSQAAFDGAMAGFHAPRAQASAASRHADASA